MIQKAYNRDQLEQQQQRCKPIITGGMVRDRMEGHKGFKESPLEGHLN